MVGAVLGMEDGTIRSGFTHDLEHSCSALGAFALHGLTAVCHCHFTGLFHVTLGLALYAICFNYCCHFLQGFSYRPIGLDYSLAM